MFTSQKIKTYNEKKNHVHVKRYIKKVFPKFDHITMSPQNNFFLAPSTEREILNCIIMQIITFRVCIVVKNIWNITLLHFDGEGWEHSQKSKIDLLSKERMIVLIFLHSKY